MGDRLAELTRAGQSTWPDNIERSMVASGALRGDRRETAAVADENVLAGSRLPLTAR
jgi:hypothetical protein